MTEPEENPSGWTDEGVPTFEHVRETIERRASTAMGAEELAADSAAGRARAEREAEHDAAARDKLEEIRRSVRGEG